MTEASSDDHINNYNTACKTTDNYHIDQGLVWLRLEAHSSDYRTNACIVQAVEALEGVRLLVGDKVGRTSLLAERPGKRMAKHKSKAISASLSSRYTSWLYTWSHAPLKHTIAQESPCLISQLLNITLASQMFICPYL